MRMLSVTRVAMLDTSSNPSSHTSWAPRNLRLRHKGQLSCFGNQVILIFEVLMAITLGCDVTVLRQQFTNVSKQNTDSIFRSDE
jgi:hypothetical protein